MNEIVVTKFGGSSLADANQFKKVKDIVLSDSKRKYVVVSAPGKRTTKDYKITDLLYLCHDHVQKGIKFEEVFDIIRTRFIELEKDLNINVGIEDKLEDIKKAIEAGASADFTASRGEYLNALLMSEYLGYEFVDASDLILFGRNEKFSLAKSRELVSQKLKNIEHAVIPGFYGRLENGRIKTFSRGGSDITGSIIANGVEASLYENWTDVSGFMMADPRIVDNPRHIDKITYKELRELSYMGATVLHEETIFPVVEMGIPINIRNTNSPCDEGTYILKTYKADTSKPTITGIAGKKDFTVIAIEKHRMNSFKDFLPKLFSIMESNNIIVEHMPSSIDTISLVISDNQLEDKLEDIIDQIKERCMPDSVEVYPNMALIAVVGKGMIKAKGMAAKTFSSLAEQSINIRMIIQGSSELNIIVGIENDDFENANRAIYNKFVNN